MHQLLWSSRLKKTIFVLTLLGSAAALGAIVWQWGWLSGGESGNTPNETLRNLGLVVAGVIAFPIAIWRAVVADRQSKAAQEQANSAVEQSKIAQQGLLHDRYQRGADMTGHANLAVRLAGIYALQRLAKENPQQYDEPILKLFCAFVRNHAEDDKSLRERSRKHIRLDKVTPEEVLAALSAIKERCHNELTPNYPLPAPVDLSGASLIGCDLPEMDLSDAILYGANLTSCNLSGSILSGAHLGRANLKKAILEHSTLSGAIIWRTDFSEISGEDANFANTSISQSNLSRANLTRASLNGTMFGDTVLENASLKEADLSWAYLSVEKKDLAAFSLKIGLTQAQLDEARWESWTPPKLNGLLDAKTLEPLILEDHLPDE